ncbi:MAG: GlsB/YeaQ/YmgE family stress response membrane protein [Actinomycetota bacterium]|nr:GlsB/YeaQ/YmgE family stress response membrane protein [Actinomycetota bacterium]
MSFLGFLILGLIAGAIAKLILPGKQGGGWFVTLLLGVIGALLGGWLGSLILNRPLTEFWDLGTWLLAIAGSIIVLLIWGLITRNRSRTT